MKIVAGKWKRRVRERVRVRVRVDKRKKYTIKKGINRQQINNTTTIIEIR
jgi:hypothetical protein